MISKTQLRSEINAKRKTLDAQWILDASTRVVDHFQKLEAFNASKTIALYMAIGGEVDLAPLFPICWTLGKRTCIPVFSETQQRYEMAEIKAETQFVTGHYGIQEPIDPTPVSTDWIELMAVPGLAFDSQGNRLGRGGGHYDRLLDGFTGHAVAVAFDFQIVPYVPCESHDKPVDMIVAETKFIKVCNEH